MKPVSRTPINVIQPGGSITIVDPATGDVRQVIGQQDDGSYGITTLNSPVPPRPSTPIVVPAQLGITASWDGLLAGDTENSINVPESNFEDGFDQWLPGGASFAQGAPHDSGLYSLEVTPVGSGYDVASASSPQIQIAGDLTYRVQGWVKLTSAVTNGISLSLAWYADDTLLSQDDSFVSASGGTWVELTNTDIAPTGATTVAIVATLNGTGDPIVGPPATDIFLLDDITLDQLVINTPADFDHVEVHVSENSNFGPDDTTLVGTLTHEGSFPVTPLDAVQQFVKLVGVNTAGGKGSASSQGFATPTEVIATDIPDGIVTTAKLATDVSGAIDDATTTASGAASDAAAAQSTATVANSAAGSAVTTANAAQAAAGTAQSTATAAQGTANTAATNAGTAITNAATAQSTANTAVTNAGTAQTTANTAVSNAASALSAANSKIKSFIQGTTPTASGTGDLWINSSLGNKISRWSGSAWVAVPVGAEALAAQLILGSTIIAGDPAGNNVALDASGLNSYAVDSTGTKVNTVSISSDGTASFNGDGVTANRVTSSVQQVNAGTQGGVFVYGTDPAVDGLTPMNPDYDFAQPDYAPYWVATNGTTPSSLFLDTNPDNTYNGAAGTLRVIYEELSSDGTIVSGEVTSNPSSRISVSEGLQYVSTLVAKVQADVFVAIVVDFYSSVSGGSKIQTKQSSSINEVGVWQTVTLSTLAPVGAKSCTIKAFGRAPAASSGQVNIGYFAISTQSAPISIAAAAGVDQYGNSYPAGISSPKIQTADLQVDGAIRAGGINAPVLMGTYGTASINGNPEFATDITGWTNLGGNAVVPYRIAWSAPSTDGYTVVNWDTTKSGSSAPFIVGPFFPVSAGVTYTLNAALQTSAASLGGYASIVWANSSGVTLGYSHGNSIGMGSWPISIASGTRPTGATQARVRITWGATPNQIGAPAAGQHLYCDYARVTTSTPGVMTFGPNAWTNDDRTPLAPAGLYLPQGYGVNIGAAGGVVGTLSGIKFGSGYSATTTGGTTPNNGIVTVTHGAGFTPDWVDINKISPNSGADHWTGFFITARTATTFTMVAFGGDSSARLGKVVNGNPVGVDLTFDYICLKF